MLLELPMQNHVDAKGPELFMHPTPNKSHHELLKITEEA